MGAATSSVSASAPYSRSSGLLPRIFIGTAGWSIPRAAAAHCGGEGTHLQRYARVFPCAEINSSFHRPHQPGTYEKWAGATPPEFRFSVKVPRRITHDQRLRRARGPLGEFLAETAGLGARRGPLLVQLPPSLEFDRRVAAQFFQVLRSLYDGMVALEPRHVTWFTPRVDALLSDHRVARVATDPACVPDAADPHGWPGLVYFRLHGSPRMYWSRYDQTYIRRLAARLLASTAATEVWCIFDNTASGAALENAVEVLGEVTA